MTRTEAHAARVAAYALALFDMRPRPMSAEMERQALQRYRLKAEQRVSEYERNGTFTDIERVA